MTMAVSTGFFKNGYGIQPDILAHQSVLVIDAGIYDRRRWTAELESVGFGLILTAGDMETADRYVRQNPCDIVFIDPNIGGTLDEGFGFIQKIKSRHPDSIIALLTGKPSLGLCYCALRAGVSDFLLKGAHLSIAAESVRLFKSRWQKTSSRVPDIALATGLFSSAGITRGELAVLEEFAKGFPKQQDIAKRLDKDEVYIRKVFSRVYKKLDSYFPVNNQAQLSHLMTICSLFN
jgi:DNA-binding NarL/FixJ family response regulator